MRLSTRITTALAGPVLAVTLGACGSDRIATPPADGRPYVDAANRTVIIPRNPTRVVTLAEGALDAALALGITPVGSTAGRGQLGIPGYLATEPGARSIPVVASTRSPNLGQIPKLRPDLIVVDDTTGSRNHLADLAKIAPTVLVAKFAQGWEKYFAAMADILGRDPQYRRVTAQIAEQLRATTALVGAAPGRKPLTASVVRWSSEGPTIVGHDSLSRWVLTDVGMARPAAQRGVDTAYRSGQKVSMENLDLIDADYIFFGVLGSTEQAEIELESARAKPVFAALRATKTGHVFPVDGTPWTSGTGPLGVRAVLDDISSAFRR